MVAINNLYESRIRLTQQQSLLRTGNINENNISIFSNTEGLTQGMIDGTCIDGKDDGKIGIGEGIKSIAKGAVKSVTNMFSSPENIVKTVATGVAGAALIAVTGGAATPFLIAGGAIAGGIQTGKGIYEATQAETDAEKRAALENVGGGAATLAMSAAAGKAYTNATGNALIGKGSLSTYKNALEASKTNVSANFGKFTTATKTAAQNASNKIGDIKISLKDTANDAYDVFNNVKSSIKSSAKEAAYNRFNNVKSTFKTASEAFKNMNINSEYVDANFKGYKNGFEYYS